MSIRIVFLRIVARYLAAVGQPALGSRRMPPRNALSFSLLARGKLVAYRLGGLWVLFQGDDHVTQVFQGGMLALS